MSLLSSLSDFSGRRHDCGKSKGKFYFNKQCCCHGRSHNICTQLNETEDVPSLLISLSTRIGADTRNVVSCVGANSSPFRVTSVLMGFEINFIVIECLQTGWKEILLNSGIYNFFQRILHVSLMNVSVSVNSNLRIVFRPKKGEEK